MPYVSGAQRGWAHTPAGEKALGGPAKVAEWDAASKGQHVPYKVAKHAEGGSVSNKGHYAVEAKYAQGGAVLPRSGDWKKTVPNRGFLDTPDRFRSDGGKNRDPRPEPTEDVWGKGSSKANPKGADKSEKPVKPRS